MLFLLLTLILNPFGLLVRWLPALYLGAWPIIIHTLGHEALLLHAVILIMFILCCDLTRELTLRLIGFDLISLPAGVALLAFLLSNTGATLISYIVPVCSGLLVITEPIFLIIELLIVMDILRALNKWISKASNVRDDDSSDLSSWEPPLSRGSILMRVVVILITIASYLGAYMLIQESKSLLGPDLPTQFNQAIALLVTLQLIAFTATVYKEEGIMSESAMVALTATVPILIASWSFYNLKASKDSSYGWASLFPFSLFGGASAGAGSELNLPLSASKPALEARPNRIVFGALDHDEGPEFAFGSAYQSHAGQLDYGALERTIHLLVPGDNFLKAALLLALRQLIMLINSLLGLSWTQLARYYFGPDFWYVLAGRLACLVWWLVCICRAPGDTSVSPATRPSSTSGGLGLARRIGRFGAGWPVSRTTLVKCLLVLAYAQMLIQQMENTHSLAPDSANLLSSGAAAEHSPTSCCGGEGGGDVATSEHAPGLLDGTATWLSCVWHSTRSCSARAAAAAVSEQQPTGSRASRYLAALVRLLAQLLGALTSVAALAWDRATSVQLGQLYSLWLVRWRSPIIQRLMQSALVQLCYICSLLLGSGDDYDENDYL